MWEHVLFLLASWAQSRRCLCHRIQTQTTFSENSSFTRNSYERWYLRARGVTLPVLAISRENRLKSRRKTKPPASSPVAYCFSSLVLRWNSHARSQFSRIVRKSISSHGHPSTTLLPGRLPTSKYPAFSRNFLLARFGSATPLRITRRPRASKANFNWRSFASVPIPLPHHRLAPSIVPVRALPLLQSTSCNPITPMKTPLPRLFRASTAKMMSVGESCISRSHAICPWSDIGGFRRRYRYTSGSCRYEVCRGRYIERISTSTQEIPSMRSVVLISVLRTTGPFPHHSISRLQESSTKKSRRESNRLLAVREIHFGLRDAE